MKWSFHQHLRRLKDLVRSGWVQRKVHRGETVASHSFAVAVLCVVLAIERGMDPARVALLALLHDLPEAITGDRTPGEVSKEEKQRSEAEAMARLDEEAHAGGRLLGLWEEYEAGRSPEAKLVRSMDLADAVLQGLAYAREGRCAAFAVRDLVEGCLSRLQEEELRGSLSKEADPGDGVGPC